MIHRNYRTRLPVFVLLCLVLIAGCGDDDDPVTPSGDDVTRETIGVGGGTLDRPGEATLAIQPGALAADVDFTMEENDSPSALPSNREGVSDVFSIGPDGTNFGVPAVLTIHYDDSGLKDASEEDIVIYTNDGSGWTPLSTTIDAEDDEASASVAHLSDYVATIPYGEAADGVYAMLDVLRSIDDLGSVNRVDLIAARFDTVIDPCNVHQSLHPDTVSCNEYPLEWDDLLKGYLDTNTMPEFLVLGEEYEFVIGGNDDVPDLTQAITMPTVAPYVTNIANEQALSLEGFTVEWTDTDGSDVLLGIVPQDSETAMVNIETPNDGEHTFSAADLSVLTPGVYVLTLHHGVHQTITATGYDPNSVIRAGSLSTTLINLTDNDTSIGPDGGLLLIGDEGYLRIPEGALSATVDFSVELVDPQPSVEATWGAMSRAWTIEPSGTTFAIPAILHFDYDEGDLGTGDESEIDVWVDEGSGWTAMEGSCFEIFDWVEAEISSLSDFQARVPLDIQAQGVYCELIAMRSVFYFDPFIDWGDEITARFDGVVGVDPVNPLQPTGVTFNDSTFTWDGTNECYGNILVPPHQLTLGDSYTFTVQEGGGVPALSQTVTCFDQNVWLTGPTSMTDVSRSGFDVTWGSTDGTGTVSIKITDFDDDVIVDIQTPNDGSFPITSADLAGSPSGLLLIEISDVETGLISAAGYDPNSFWKLYTLSIATPSLVD